MRKKKDPIPTPEDREHVLEQIATVRERMMERLVLEQARARLAREEQERRRRRLNRFSFGLVGRD
jgi:hypothetical protein